VEVTTEIASWGDSHETRSNNPGARFNAALRSYFYRPATTTNLLPFSSVETLSITFTDGTTISLPWMVFYGEGLGDPNACLLDPPDTVSITARPPSFAHQLLDDSPPQVLHAPSLTKDRSDRTVIIDPEETTTTLSCFTQSLPGSATATAAGVKNVLVMKVASFSPPQQPYADAWAAFLGDAATCLGEEYVRAKRAQR
jgi:hypothetical protein